VTAVLPSSSYSKSALCSVMGAKVGTSAIAIASTVSGTRVAKVLRCGTRDQLLGVLWLGGASWGKDQIVDPEIYQGHNAGHNGQPSVGARPVLQFQVPLPASLCVYFY